jgi:hypothetical protein
MRSKIIHHSLEEFNWSLNQNENFKTAFHIKPVRAIDRLLFRLLHENVESKQMIINDYYSLQPLKSTAVKEDTFTSQCFLSVYLRRSYIVAAVLISSVSNYCVA